GDGQSFAFSEQREDSAPHGSSCELELSARHGPVADAVPQPEQLPPLGKQALAEELRLVAVVEEGLEVARQMAPAELPALGGDPVVGSPAVRREDAGEGLGE